MTQPLAPDAVLPQRDALLDPATVARALGVAADGCEVVRVKYRVGESLRVRYRVAGRDVACRAFPPGRSERAYRQAVDRALPAGWLRPVRWSPELESVFWAFPNDRKLSLDALVRPIGLVGGEADSWRLVAYAPEKSATARWETRDGVAVAYVKVYADGETAARACATYERLADAVGSDDPLLRLPSVLAHRPALRAIALEPLPGQPLAELAGRAVEDAYRRLGGAVARFHDLPPAGEPFRRLDLARVTRAAALVARARPDVETAAAALVAELERHVASVDGPAVCLHGDLHAKNVLLGRRTALVDLDQAGTGPAAADLGSVLAALRYARVADGLPHRSESRLGEAFLGGYGAVRPLPPDGALRWHTAAALLAERALRAVNRVRAPGLLHLRALLTDARTLLDA